MLHFGSKWPMSSSTPFNLPRKEGGTSGGRRRNNGMKSQPPPVVPSLNCSRTWNLNFNDSENTDNLSFPPATGSQPICLGHTLCPRMGLVREFFLHACFQARAGDALWALPRPRGKVKGLKSPGHSADWTQGFRVSRLLKLSNRRIPVSTGSEERGRCHLGGSSPGRGCQVSL